MPFSNHVAVIHELLPYLAENRLDAGVRLLERFLARQPKTPMHWLVGRNLQRHLGPYRRWLCACCDDLPRADASVVIQASLGDLECNYQPWAASAVYRAGYFGTVELYGWMCEHRDRVWMLGDEFQFPRLTRLARAFEIGEAEETSISDETFTAVSFLLFVRFLELNRDAHAAAARDGHPLARCHLACDYGDVVYHLPPALPRLRSLSSRTRL